MTQKELLYLEDAIEHEKNIITICEDTKERVEDEKLINFFENEINEHRNLKEKLIKTLEEKANE